MNLNESKKLEGETRPVPFWSVMIPTYNAPVSYLEAALKSVLDQDPGPADMQIQIVDDCSPQGAPLATIGRMGGGRVEFFQNRQNLGLAATWNECIKRAIGQCVHILHQDDLVKPGFYARLRCGLEAHPEVGAAFCRHAFIDEYGNETGISDLEAVTAGKLADFHLKMARANKIQFASIAVRKSTYEHVAPFNRDFPFVLDWDMWLRISLLKPIWYEPSVMACYRFHDSAATSRIQRSAEDVRDIDHFLKHAENYFTNSEASTLLAEARKTCAVRAVDTANRFLENGERSAAFRQLFAGWRLHPSPALFLGSARFLKKLIFLESPSARRSLSLLP
jgi:GT2 family glycosyltransferase